jgi:DNA-binding GntR family transcriptional regulator
MSVWELDPEGIGGRRTAHEFVRDTLRQAILRGTLPGGTHLIQADIAQQLAVSTTPVREALRDLATEGLIKLDAHRGAIVHALEYEEVREIYGIRRILEPEAMRRAVRTIKPATLEQAKLLQERMESERDAGTWADLNREFHGLLAQDVASVRLSAILQSLRDAAAPYVGFLLRTFEVDRGAADRDHRELLAAIEAGHERTAADVTRRHLEQTVDALWQAHLERQHATDGRVADGSRAARPVAGAAEPE